MKMLVYDINIGENINYIRILAGKKDGKKKLFYVKYKVRKKRNKFFVRN